MRKITAIIAAGLFSLYAAGAMAATYIGPISSDNQLAAAPNTAYAVTMKSDPASGFKLEGSKTTVLKGGDYLVVAAAQLGGTTSGNIWLWVRLNGKDVPDSNSIQTIPSKDFTAVLVSQGIMTLKAGDVIEIMYQTSAPGLGLIATKPANMPAVPSIIFTVAKM